MKIYQNWSQLCQHLKRTVKATWLSFKTLMIMLLLMMIMKMVVMNHVDDDDVHERNREQ